MIHTATIEPDGRPLRPDAPMRWNVVFNGELIVTGARDPEHAACRALAARGITGRISFHHSSGITGLTLDIETGAGLTVWEGADSRLRLARWKPSPRGVESSGKPIQAAPGGDVPDRDASANLDAAE